MSRVCAISFKECWRGEDGRWYSSGGFPLQMSAIGSLFDEMTLVVTEVESRDGGIALPEAARVVPIRKPEGVGFKRKISVVSRLHEYVPVLLREIGGTDVVHVPLPGDIPLVGMILTLLRRRHLLARFCGAWRPVMRPSLMNRVTRAMMRLFAGGKNIMLATGEEETPPAEGMHWIFATAISKEELKRVQPRLDRGLAWPPRLAYVGRLSPEKGVDVLVRAVAELRRTGFRPMPRVVLMGDGPERMRLESMVRELSVEDFFEFAGQLNRQALLTRLMECDFCVQPSLTEGFSKAWLDAFMCGLPVLTTDVSSAQAVIGRNGERGWIVRRGDVHALADGLGWVLRARDVDWPALRRRCREYAEQRTLEVWARRIGEICGRQWGWGLRDGKLRSRSES